MKCLIVGISFLVSIAGVTNLLDYTSPDQQIILTWESAASEGDDAAQLALGWAYANGMGVTQDYSMAMKWWRKSAEQNNSDAQLMLAIMYSECDAITQDYSLAEKWYRCAADNGNIKALRRLNMLPYFMLFSDAASPD